MLIKIGVVALLSSLIQQYCNRIGWSILELVDIFDEMQFSIMVISYIIHGNEIFVLSCLCIFYVVAKCYVLS